MDLSEEDDSIFTFSVPYDDTGDRKISYDEIHAIVVDKDKRRIGPFKKLPVLVEDTDVDVGDLIIHNYAHKTPVGTQHLGSIKLDDLTNGGRQELPVAKDSPGESEEEQENEENSENESCEDSVEENSSTNAEERASVINIGLNENNNSNESHTDHKIGLDDLVELDSSYVTTSDESPNTTQQNVTITPPGGQLLGGNAESLSLDLSLSENDCEFHQTSHLSTGLLARHLPAPRFVAHQMALSISPERYMPKTRPKSNRFSVSSSSPSEDGSQFELWARKKTSKSKRTRNTKLCIGLTTTLFIAIILSIIIVPIVFVSSQSNNVISGFTGLNSTQSSNVTTTLETMSTSDNTQTINDVTAVMHNINFITSDVIATRTSLSHTTSESDDLTLRHTLHDITSSSTYEVTSIHDDITTNSDITEIVLPSDDDVTVVT